MPEGVQGWLFSKVVATQIFSYFHPGPWGFMIQFDEHIDSKTPSILKVGTTVDDGSEIRRENQLRLVVYPIIYKVLTSQVIVWDFFHQQYVSFRDGKSVKEKHHTPN